MPRKIYEYAIYQRPRQMVRKVYDRPRNVIPTEPPAPPADEYTITAAVVKVDGSNYDDSFTMTVEGGVENAVLNITAQDGKIKDVTVTSGGKYAADVSGDVEVTDGNGTGGSITITATKVKQ